MRAVRYFLHRKTDASQTALHLFRALLRECTYLPDPNARKIIHKHVVSRFQAYVPPPWSRPWELRRYSAVISQRLPRLLKKAEKSLRDLKRANFGHPHPLSRVLALTYGRIGPRRHQMLQELKVADGPRHTGEFETVIKAHSGPKMERVPRPSEKLLALLESQSQQPKGNFTLRAFKKKWHLRIPEKNNWGRPLPLRRVRNMQRRWYAGVLNRLMPPLPKSEWIYLSKIVNREVPFRGPIPRRGNISSTEDGLSSYRGVDNISRPHVISGRFMRRLLALLFRQCPLMERDQGASRNWRIQWGNVSRKSQIRLQQSAGIDIRSLFGGVDELGDIGGGLRQRERERLQP